MSLIDINQTEPQNLCQMPNMMPDCQQMLTPLCVPLSPLHAPLYPTTVPKYGAFQLKDS